MEIVIEITRRIGPEAHRAVIDQRLGMDEPVLEGKPIDERLQRRARRAHRKRKIDLPGAGAVEIADAADMGEDFARRIVDGDDRRRNAAADRLGTLSRQPLEGCLERARDRRALNASLRLGLDEALGDMGGKHRERLAAGRHILMLSSLRLIPVDDTLGHKPRQHPVAGDARALSITVGAAALRRLRQGDEQRRFGRGKAPGLLAEIGKGCGAGAFDIAAIGRERQIESEDLLLAQPPFDLECADHLGELGPKRPLGARLEQAGHLHGERRSSGDHPAVPYRLCGGAQQSCKIHAWMRIEALVLIGDEHRKEARIDIAGARRQPPIALLGGEGPEQFAVAIDHDRRISDGFAQGRRPETPERLGDAQADRIDRDE